MKFTKEWLICKIYCNFISNNIRKITLLYALNILISCTLALGFKVTSDYEEIYSELKLADKLDFHIFKKALKEKNRFSLNTKYLSIIDFNKASTEKRFFLIDLQRKKLLYQTYVAHGRNSGENFPTSFSNTEESHKSSLGIYTTADTYIGKHGYSLRLIGLDPQKNDNAEKRAIVIHGADYVSEKFIQKHGRLGRSHGCPALPEDLVKEIIDLTKGGSCLYIHYEKN